MQWPPLEKENRGCMIFLLCNFYIVKKFKIPQTSTKKKQLLTISGAYKKIYVELLLKFQAIIYFLIGKGGSRWIRIWIQVGNNGPQRKKKVKKCIVLKSWGLPFEGWRLLLQVQVERPSNFSNCDCAIFYIQMAGSGSGSGSALKPKLIHNIAKR